MSKKVLGGLTRGPDGSVLPLSKAVKAGDLLFLSGQVPVDASGALIGGGIEEQARQVLENVSAVLASCNAALSDVVKVTVWLVDKSHFAGFNRVYSKYFPSEPPARTTVISGLAIDALIELEVVAHVAPRGEH